MKCPKCGSEKTACFPECPEAIAYCRCHNCEHIFDYTNDMIHQQRLDKVLSKFEKDEDRTVSGLVYNITETEDLLSLDSNIKVKVYLYTETRGKLFLLMIETYIDNEWMTTIELERSLDTVENILLDMEAQDES